MMRDLSKDSTHLYVEDRVQTFIDNLVIESVQDITRRWHTPQRYQDGPVLKKDRPWEVNPMLSYSSYCVLRDPDDGLFKCWYEQMTGQPNKKLMALGMESQQLYAESEDGIHWTKPELDLFKVDGRKTNIVLGRGEHCMSVLIDPHSKSNEDRFKGFYTRMWDNNSQRQSQCAYSADGIHWQSYDELPQLGMAGPRLCDVTILFYDEDAREFVQNTRHIFMTAAATRSQWDLDESFARPYEPDYYASYNQRRIWQSRSSDFLHWSEPVLVAACDEEEDNLDESLYGMPQFKVGTVHLATVGVFRAVDNEMDVQLLVSRDGLRWQRTMKRQPFLAPRGEGNWDAHMVSMTSPPIEVQDQLYFFHGGTNFHHDWWLVGAREGIDHPETIDPLGCGAGFGLGLATLRKDGYAGLYANQYRTGVLITRPLISMGSQLEVNAKCAPGGSVRVEVADRFDQVAEPCNRDNCDPLTGDSVANTVTWQGSPKIPTGRDRGMFWRKLKFYLHDAELFSFRFKDLVEDQKQFKTEKEW